MSIMSLRILRIIVVVGLISPALWSQSGLPDPLSGNAMRPTFGGETKSTNTLTTTLRVSTDIDDNALNNNANKLTDYITRFDPNFVWNLSRRRWSMETDYTPGFSYSVELPRYRTFSHNLHNSLNLMLARHVNLQLRNAFIRTSDPFDRLSAFQSGPGFGVLDSTNPSYLGAPTLYTSNQSGLDLTYQPAAHTTLGVSGSYAIKTFDDLITNATYNRDTHVATGRVFANQQLSPRQSVGVSYDYSVITSGIYGRTVAHSILLFDSWQLNPKVSVSVFAGPQYTDVAYGSALSPVPLQSGWSYSAGGTLAWHGQRTGLTGSVVRRISDGGGLGGAVEMTNITAGLSRKLGRDWTATLDGGYTINGSNAVANSYPSYSYLVAGAGISRRIGRNFSFDTRYAYSHDDRSVSSTPFGLLADHNRVSFGFSYTFSNRLGM
jgi:hypothetical protein